MCMCGKPTINGQPGYSWNGETASVRPVSPPELAEGDELIFDEPGRCGGMDSHSYHFRIVKNRCGGFDILVRHGGGDERIGLTARRGAVPFSGMDSEARYWALQMLYHTQERARCDARDRERQMWRKAAAEKRIKTRRLPAQGTVKVWIEEAAAV